MSVSAPHRVALPVTTPDKVDAHGGLWPKLLGFCRRERLGTFGLIIVIVMAICGLSADLIAPYSPTANDFAAMTEAPSWAHWLGTDQFGRDLLSRIIFGARTALIVGLASALIGGVFRGSQTRFYLSVPIATSFNPVASFPFNLRF